ncbi:hypothetical protein NTE_03417 [Candidatus Nitrososphaera evergladensis SR1]|uniref:Uncharacterized protein n=1 Tax=Candidatus Nitrososphaera evergladensis SR1 TaxID=1459636 RepID=A0A075MW14_9ARCH|nr:hypothetical protein [Candidatus Nitrososphaera evergladensis]AIF85445.1 hypothetical protein NTE_03417 [Candidatus Nitrososphaera evergladensis SR1]
MAHAWKKRGVGRTVASFFYHPSKSDRIKYTPCTDVRLGGIFEHKDVYLVDMHGDGNIHGHIDLIKAYRIKHVVMADSQYRKNEYKMTKDVMTLPGKLENELARFGWFRAVKPSASPEKVYEFVMKKMKEKATGEKIRTSNLGKVFEVVLEKVGEEPERVWNQFL